jgi:hypothetical protein
VQVHAQADLVDADLLEHGRAGEGTDRLEEPVLSSFRPDAPRL